MDHTKVKNFLQDNGTDWLVMIKKSPTASHMGGVWEQKNMICKKHFALPAEDT